MRKNLIKLAFIVALVALVGIAFAPSHSSQAAVTDYNRYLGSFDGSEASNPQVHCGSGSLYTDIIGPVQASASGVYNYYDISIGYSVDMQIGIYQNSYDPANPTTNRINSFDDGGTTNLSAGTNYYLVIQPLCGNTTGTWDFTLKGPGSLTGAIIASAEYAFNIDGSEPSYASQSCGTINYEVQGPLQVASTGNYVFFTISAWTTSSGSVEVYAGAFDPANPATNRVAVSAGGYGYSYSYNLTAGTNYIFVMGRCGSGTGNVEIVMFGNATISAPAPAGSAPSVAVPPDARLNWLVGDTEIVLYPALDDDGNRTMQAYCVNSAAQGFLGLVIAQTDLPEVAPAENTLLLESDICDIEFWVLAEGSQFNYQLNFGPNINGSVIELLFNDLNAADITMRAFNLYDLGD